MTRKEDARGWRCKRATRDSPKASPARGGVPQGRRGLSSLRVLFPFRHCERHFPSPASALFSSLHPFPFPVIASEAKQSQPDADKKDCFVISFLAMTWAAMWTIDCFVTYVPRNDDTWGAFFTDNNNVFLFLRLSNPSGTPCQKRDAPQLMRVVL